MPDEFVQTFGPNPFISAIAARRNAGLELVEMELLGTGGTTLFYLDQGAAATHAEQVNRSLRETYGGHLVVVEFKDRYRLVTGSEEDPNVEGYAVDDPDVQRRSLQSLAARRPGEDPRIQVQTVIEHAWRDFERSAEKVTL